MTAHTDCYGNPFDPSDYVHEIELPGGAIRWVVATLGADGRYTAPLRSEARRRSGCSSNYGPLSYVYSGAYHYARRSDALRRARQVYLGEDGA